MEVLPRDCFKEILCYFTYKEVIKLKCVSKSMLIDIYKLENKFWIDKFHSEHNFYCDKKIPYDVALYKIILITKGNLYKSLFKLAQESNEESYNILKGFISSYEDNLNNVNKKHLHHCDVILACTLDDNMLLRRLLKKDRNFPKVVCQVIRKQLEKTHANKCIAEFLLYHQFVENISLYCPHMINNDNKELISEHIKENIKTCKDVKKWLEDCNISLKDNIDFIISILPKLIMNNTNVYLMKKYRNIPEIVFALISNKHFCLNRNIINSMLHNTSIATIKLLLADPRIELDRDIMKTAAFNGNKASLIIKDFRINLDDYKYNYNDKYIRNLVQNEKNRRRKITNLNLYQLMNLVLSELYMCTDKSLKTMINITNKYYKMNKLDKNSSNIVSLNEFQSINNESKYISKNLNLFNTHLLNLFKNGCVKKGDIDICLPHNIRGNCEID